ncbi:MAG TPA: type III pantothenate kinase [Dehalococcoidia bacterium]|nr:type III pantothenate kinase [Dehalococcoidia bacterium]
MLLAIDIGNTNITVGLFNGDILSATWRISTDSSKTSDEYGLQLTQMLEGRKTDVGGISHVVICSVVPPLTPTFQSLCQRYFRADPLVVGAGTKTGVQVMYDSPRDVGTDRIVDAAAALHFYGGPAIIVDLGTATVFDAITKSGEYLGGAIAPGMEVSADALFRATSQLRRVELTAPETAIGRNTPHSIQSGLVLGYTELVKGMIKRFKEELSNEACVIGTGGLANIVQKESSVFDTVDPDLTLKGLQIVHSLNEFAK